MRSPCRRSGSQWSRAARPGSLQTRFGSAASWWRLPILIVPFPFQNSSCLILKQETSKSSTFLPETPIAFFSGKKPLQPNAFPQEVAGLGRSVCRCLRSSGPSSRRGRRSVLPRPHFRSAERQGVLTRQVRFEQEGHLCHHQHSWGHVGLCLPAGRLFRAVRSWRCAWGCLRWRRYLSVCVWHWTLPHPTQPRQGPHYCPRRRKDMRLGNLQRSLLPKGRIYRRRLRGRCLPVRQAERRR